MFVIDEVLPLRLGIVGAFFILWKQAETDSTSVLLSHMIYISDLHMLILYLCI